jgi:RNA 2',3'-cyclic 3'-phosphodiesterase
VVEGELTPTGNVFVAVVPPPEVVAALAERLEDLPIPGRLVPPPNFHITLRFVGKVDPVSYDRLLASLATRSLVEPFRVRLGGFGAFPNPRRATVVWVGVDADPALEDLAAIVEDAVVTAGFDPEERPFFPHLTVARVRPPENVSGLSAGEWRLPFPVEEIHVMAAWGSRYRVYETFSL